MTIITIRSPDVDADVFVLFVRRIYGFGKQIAHLLCGN